MIHKIFSKNKTGVSLNKVYPFDKRTNSYIIEISVKNYESIFNSWDNSILEKRDINPALKIYLEECARDIPLNYNIILKLHVYQKSKDKEMEISIKKGLSNYFKFYQYFLHKDKEKLTNKALDFILKAFFFLLIAILFERFAKTFIAKILLEGLFIGGWVFLWEAFSVAFFESGDIKSKLKIYERFSNSKTIFRYTKES